MASVLASLPRGLADLPDELVSCIIEHVSRRALPNLCLVSKRLDRLAKPLLFQGMDLGVYAPPELWRLYNRLFLDEHGRRGALVGMHFESLSYRIVEEMATDDEFVEAFDTFVKILDNTGSVAKLVLEVSLIIDEAAALHDALLSALQRVVRSASTKGVKYKLWLDAFNHKDVKDKSRDIAASRLATSLEVFPTASVVSLHLNGLRMESLPETLQSRFASAALEDLAIRGCSDFFQCESLPSSLQCLRFSWQSTQKAGMADFQTALRLIEACASSLRLIVLHNLMSQQYTPRPGQQSTIRLPQLRELQITDVGLGHGSVLDCFLTHTVLPNLKILDLETEDILKLDRDVTELLGHLPSLERLQLNENHIGMGAQVTSTGSTCATLETACMQRGITLRTMYSSFRCDVLADLKYELSRMTLFSNTLTQINFTCCPEPLAGIEGQRSVDLPRLRKLWIAVSDRLAPCIKSGHNQVQPASASPLYALLNRFRAPVCAELQLTLFVNGTHVSDTLLGLERAIEDKLYPSLKELSGNVMSLPGTPRDEIASYETRLRALCAASRIDCKAFRFNGKNAEDSISDDDDATWISDLMHETSRDKNLSQSADLLGISDNYLPDEGCKISLHSRESGDSASNSDGSWMTDVTDFP